MIRLGNDLFEVRVSQRPDKTRPEKLSTMRKNLKLTNCKHKNFSLEILIDRPIDGNTVSAGNDQPAMKMWADNQGFKTTKRCDDCGERL